MRTDLASVTRGNYPALTFAKFLEAKELRTLRIGAERE